MPSGVERFLLYNPVTQQYLCGSFLDPDIRRAYLFQSLAFARQGWMKSLVDLGDKSQWVIQRAMVDWDSFGDLTQVEVVEEIKP